MYIWLKPKTEAMEDINIVWQKVSFNEYLKNDGTLIKTKGFNLNGEVQIFNDLDCTKKILKYANVYCINGKVYFVPFESLTFLNELN